MKKIFRILAAGLALTVSLTACNEKEFLEEHPLSTYTAGNALASYTDFHGAVNYIHQQWRNFTFSSADGAFAMYYGTDLAFCACDTGRFNKIKDSVVPSAGYSSDVWNPMYVIVTQANFILTRLEENETLTTAERNEIRGQALFWRAWAYRLLCHIFGGVPLIEEEITAPHKDFVRATREETYKFIQKDLTEAIGLLKDINEVPDGAISKQLCQHVLAEINICLGDYEGAINAAKAVIDHPATGLMTERFGTFKDKEGSAYSDLFKLHNQNRTSGNTEGLFVNQYEYNVDGIAQDNRVWTFLPWITGITITYEGVTATFRKGVEEEDGGRGVAWMQLTDHVINGIWENDEGDLRNAPYLIVRDYMCDNETSPAFGMWMVKDDILNKCNVNVVRNWFAGFMKVWSGWVPEDFYQKDANGNPVLTVEGHHLCTNNANGSFTDTYNVRLAETYLLLAEAYLDKGDKASAADAINVVRARSEAPLIAAGDVDIDFILDERLRELATEEMRMLTLCRLGKLADRTRRYNKTYLGNDKTQWESTGLSIEDYHNLWPIPYSEIERNTEALIEQNPGYTN